MLNKFKTWWKNQGATRQAAYIAGIFTIISALILYDPSPATQTQATQTSVPTLEMPPNSVQLPQANYTGISITIDPSPDYWFHGKILTSFKTDQKTIIYHDELIDTSNSATLENFVNSIGTIHVILNGKSDEEPVTVDNKIPIKILSYEPNFKTYNLMGTCTGGAVEAYLMQADVSGKSVNNPEQVVWATYRNDLIKLLQEHPEFFNLTSNSQSLPSELIKVINGQQATMPDAFTLKKDEGVLISVSLVFKDPGIYKIQFGVQYTYNGTKGVAWVDQPLVINVFGSSKIWGCWQMAQDGTEVKLTEACNLALVTNSTVRNYEYRCEKYTYPTPTPHVINDTPQSYDKCSWGKKIIGSWLPATGNQFDVVFSSDGQGYWATSEMTFNCYITDDLLGLTDTYNKTYYYTVTFVDDNTMKLTLVSPSQSGPIAFVRQK